MATKKPDRQFDRNVGGGVDRAKLAAGDFVIPQGRKFPIVTPADVSDAVSSFGRSKGVDFATFKRRLIALAKRKGAEFVAALPDEWKREMNMESAAPRKVLDTAVFVEALDLTEATLDSEARVVNDVVLIRSGMSDNRRYYAEPVLEAAATVFEGAKAYADHPSKRDAKERPERSVRDLTGWYSNVRYQEGALRADRYFAKTQAGQDVWAIVEDVVSGRAPGTLAGLSINAVGHASKQEFDDGEALNVEAITAAVSVDDVTTPAAGGTYLAASAGDEIMSGVLGALSFEEWREARPEFVEQLKREWQVVRQTEAVKAAQAEADQLRTALDSERKAHAQDNARHAAALTEAERLLSEAREASDELAARATTARLNAAVDKALRSVRLSDEWRESLRGRLLAADPATWDEILTEEATKARSVARESRRETPGAGKRVTPPLPTPTKAKAGDVVPRDGESFAEWQRRVAG